MFDEGSHPAPPPEALPGGRLLVATDLSRGAEAAVALAAQVSREMTVQAVQLLHAPAWSLDAKQRDALLRELGTRAEQAFATPAEVRLLPSEAPIESSLASLAEGDDWIVLGCEGCGASAQRRGGERVRAACRTSRHPVLVAPPRWQAPDKRRARVLRAFTRVGVVVDGSEATQERDRALITLGRRLTRGPGDELLVVAGLDASDLRHYPESLRREGRRVWDLRREEVEDVLFELLDEAAPTARPAVLENGPPARDVAGWARSQSVELLIVGVGELAATLTAVTGCPMLAWPPDGSLDA
ncbi:MAG: hypothetical protein AAF533_12585 [Acidobacteriota bacterium]